MLRAATLGWDETQWSEVVRNALTQALNLTNNDVLCVQNNILFFFFMEITAQKALFAYAF